MKNEYRAPDGFDGERFDRLLVMVGDNRTLLLDHAMNDLAKIRAGLIGDATQRQLRDSIHTLISLAGTLGGIRLMGLAEAMQKAEAITRPDLTEALNQLDGLVAYLAARRQTA